MRRLRSYRQIRAFTMVELLTVIGIIAVLAALTLGAMAPARERARRNTCSSNLHQFHLALKMYSQDWDGREPEIGLKLTAAEMGLPPENSKIQFYKAYGFWNTPVLRCPSFRQIKGQARLFTPYIVWLGSDAEACGVVRGGAAPLVTCDVHNERLFGEPQPTWNRFSSNLVRHSGQVSFSTRTYKDVGDCGW